MNSTPAIAIFLCICFFQLNSTQISGDNVCPEEEENEELSLQKHEQAVVLRTTEFCLDATKGFRCTIKKNGTKISYKGVPTKVRRLVHKCCHGFRRTDDDRCEVCPDGSYGSNCSLLCNCTSPQICNNVVGCCDPARNECRVARSDALQQSRVTGKWMLAIMLASMLAIVVLAVGIIFYRRKYIKEKDPDLPTLTYYPYVKKQFATAEDIESREFNNPLYRQSASELVPTKIVNDTDLVTGNGQNLPNSNEYATLDEVSTTIAGPSNTYEVPYQSTTPSTAALMLENRANERKESL